MIVRKVTPKALVKKWITALRSKKYKQTTGELKNSESGYCCLGVLCEVAIENGFKIKRNDPKKKPTGYTYRGQLFDSLPPTILQTFLGLNAELGNGDLDINTLADKLVEMNDNKKWSFRSIATYIEKKILPTL